MILPLKGINLPQIGEDRVSLSLEKGGDILIGKHGMIRLNKCLQRLDIGQLRRDKFRKNHTKGRREEEKKGEKERVRGRGGGEREREREGGRERVILCNYYTNLSQWSTSSS